MHQGKMNGYFCQGFNPLISFPNKGKLKAAMAKLKFLVVMDPLETETARFWEDHGEFNPSKPEEIKTEVFELPTTCFAEDEGSLTNSSRWLQWHWPGGTPPGEAKTDAWIMAQIHLRLKELYKKEGGAFADPILNLHWPYKDANDPHPAEIAKEINGYVVEDVPDPADPTKLVLQKGKQVAALRRPARRRHDRVWLLDLLRLLQRGRQQHGAPRQVRSGRHRGVPEVGVLVAGQSPHPLQSCLRGSPGQGLGSQAQADRVGRRQVGRVRRARHRDRR